MKNIKYIFILLLVSVTTISVNCYGWEMANGQLMTQWAADIDPQNVLPEYPRPQMVRDDYMTLNGIWQFQEAFSGENAPVGTDLTDEILVPFPVESAISGVYQHYDRLWYRRSFDVPQGWNGKNIILHFGAVDWESEVFINGTSLGVHKGGYDAFSYDITPYLVSGSQELIVRVYDPTNSQAIACGKQDLNPSGIWYTAVTGIWQTVWIEPVASRSIESLKLVPDVDSSLLNVTGFVRGDTSGISVTATAYDGDLIVGIVTGPADTQMQMQIRDPKLWSPNNPFLYDLEVVLKYDDIVVDTVSSYFGMRKIELKMVNDYNRIFLNDEYFFQIGPLDQGWWPDGLYTAPTDEALKYDLDKIKEYGFNMVRKHVKVEPARWYYWADKLGLLVWQDMPSMRGAPGDAAGRMQFEGEMATMVEQHGNHPSIILWVVFNEGWGQYDTVRNTNNVMAQDPSRLVSCASGWTDYPVGNIIDRHSYPTPGAPEYTTSRAMVCGEYGGIGMYVDDHVWDASSWSYTMVQNAETLESVYDSYIQTLMGLEASGLNAGVYTQITDVEGELNGLMTYDRIDKGTPAHIAQSNSMNYSFEVVISTSESEGQQWYYTFDEPNSNWMDPAFNDSSWSIGDGGFGTSGTPGAVVRTTWNTDNIWLRKTFDFNSITEDQIDDLMFRIHHDEDVEIYINSVLAGSINNYTSNYINFRLNEAGKAAIIPGHDNLVAVHCSQTTGGQYIDLGFAVQLQLSQHDKCGTLGYNIADFNRDCVVNIEDMAELAENWLKQY